MHLRFSFFILLLIYLVGCSSNPDQSAANAFKAGNIELAEQILQKDRSSIPAARYSLDRAYIQRAKNQISQSTAQLENATSYLPKNASPQESLRKEIWLNTAFNAFLLNDNNALKKILKDNEKTYGEDDPWVIFFKGLSYYLDQDYQNAHALWKDTRIPPYLSIWMEAAFEKAFTQEWLQTFQTRARIFSGDFLSARQTLQNSANAKDESTQVLIGLTYVQEAQSKAPSAAIPYYKIALNYFNRIPEFTKKYPLDAQFINNELLKETSLLLETHQYKDLPFYIDALQNWDMGLQLEQLSEKVIQNFDRVIQNGNWTEFNSLIPILEELLTTPQAKEMLSQKLTKLVLDKIKDNQLSQAKEIVKLAKIFSPNPEAVSQIIAKNIENQIDIDSKNPNFDLERMEQLINMWTEQDISIADRLAFGNNLLRLSRSIWTRRGLEKNAIAIMRFAATVIPVNQRHAFNQNIGDLLKSIYSIALTNGDFEKLSFILEAEMFFDLPNTNLVSSTELVNLLEDAKLLYKQQNFEKAFQVASWITQLEPNRQAALKIAALSAYHLGEYKNAYFFFSRLTENSYDTLLPRIFSEMAVGDKDKGIQALEQYLKSYKLDENDFEKLAIIALNQNDLDLFSYVLKQSPENNELKALSIFAAFANKDYQQVLEIYSALPSPYNKLEGIQSITALSAIYLNNRTEAQKMVQQLQSGKFMSTASLDPPYKKFLDSSTSTPSTAYVFAMFYKDIALDQNKALSYFESLKNPSFDMLMSHAQLLIELNKLEEALPILLSAQVKSDKLKKELSPVYWENLALVQQRLGAYLEAYLAWKKLFSMIEPSQEQIRSYVDCLISLRLFDLANQEIQKITEPTLSDKIRLLRIGFNLHDVGSIYRDAAALNAIIPKHDSYNRINLAEVLALANYTSLLKEVLSDLPATDTLDQIDTAKLIYVYYLMGDYNNAIALYNSKKGTLNGSKVHMTMAKIYFNLSENEKAIAEAHKSIEEIPFFVPSTQYYILNAKDSAFINDWIQTFSTLYQKNDLQYSYILLYALALKEKAKQDMNRKVSGFAPNLSTALRANSIIKEMIDKIPDIPELYLYYGQTFSIQGQDNAALEAFSKAIELDPSYAEAYYASALILASQNKWLDAANFLRQAIFYKPNFGHAWLKLAQSESQIGNSFDALEAYERAVYYLPNESSIYIERGQLAIDNNNPETAITSFEHALMLKPNDYDILKLLLKALYDPNLFIDKDSQVLTRQKEVYEQLYRINPKEASTLKAKLIKGWK